MFAKIAKVTWIVCKPRTKRLVASDGPTSEIPNNVT